MWFNSEKVEKTVYSTRCYESHTGMKIGNGMLYGGNASSPIVSADVYVSLQVGSSCSKISDPWEKQTTIEVHYSIVDRGIPNNLDRFKKMIDWLCNQLQEGKTVHVGCIGGHGRTGLVLSAIVRKMLDEKDAIKYVRKNYCSKAVESKTQVDFLVKHYDVVATLPSKGDVEYVNKDVNGKHQRKFWENSYEHTDPAEYKKSDAQIRLVKKIVPPNVSSKTKVFVPMKSSRCIWGKKIENN